MIDPPYYTLRMAMGKRKRDQQPTIWVAVNDLPRSVSHPFYEKLNRLLAEQGCDDFVETQCRRTSQRYMGSILSRNEPSEKPRTIHNGSARPS